MAGGRVVLAASIGFTIDFVVRRVADLGRGSVSHVVAVGLASGDESSWRRVEEAYKLLSHYLTSLGIGSELYRVELGRNLVREARNAIARASGLAGPDGQVEVYVTGGPRILVLALTVAALTSSDEVRRRTRIVAYGENFEGSLEIPVGLLTDILSLDKESARIVDTLSRMGPMRAEDLRSSLNMVRSTLYKKLRDLHSKGIVDKDDSLWRLDRRVEQLI